MNKGYWIVSADVSDMEKFSEYKARTPAAMKKYGGKFLAKAGATQIVEGSSRGRNSIIEFPSYQHALDCWHSEEYQIAKQHRDGIAQFDVVIIEGAS